MSLNNISVVLVRTSHPGNIGASARAMANMGLSDLRLVEPSVFPSEETTARAAGAVTILENAKIYGTLDDAVADASLIFGASARRRTVAWPQSDIASAMNEAATISLGNKVALVFGREASGLTNKELERCQRHVRIPVNEDFPSLNLAAAVLLFGYELRRAFDPRKDILEDIISTKTPLATADQVQGFFNHLEIVLNEIEFFNSPSDRLFRKIKRIFSRSPLQEEDINILRGILTSIQYQRATKTDR